MSKVQSVAVRASPCSFGWVLRELRESRRLSMEDLAERAHLTHSTISRWEWGKRRPARRPLEQVVMALRATPQERARLLAAAGYTEPGSEPLLPEIAQLQQLLSGDELLPHQRQMLREILQNLVRLVSKQVSY